MLVNTLWISLKILQDTGKMVIWVSLARIFFLFSCGVSLCKIILQGRTARKDSYLARNSAVFLCCAKSVSDDECSVLLYFFHRC